MIFSVNVTKSHETADLFTFTEEILNGKPFCAVVSVLESLFNKISGFQAWNFIEKRLQHRCFPVNVTKLLRTAFL